METSIPINHYLAAAKDVELKKLLRAKATAEGRVKRAEEQVAAAEDAISFYIAANYPATEPAEVSA